MKWGIDKIWCGKRTCYEKVIMNIKQMSEKSYSDELWNQS